MEITDLVGRIALTALLKRFLCQQYTPDVVGHSGLGRTTERITGVRYQVDW